MGFFIELGGEGFLIKVVCWIFPLFQVTYKWLSYTLGVHVNQAKQ